MTRNYEDATEITELNRESGHGELASSGLAGAVWGMCTCAVCVMV